MDTDEVWRAIDTHRLAVAGLLGQLSPGEWTQPSLCAGWTVRDVAAHLTLQQLGLKQAAGMAIRFPGGMNRMIRESARRQATLTPDQLSAAIRGMIGSRRHNIGVTCRETLIDILVHSQDIAVPLGRPLPLDPLAAAEAASRVWAIGWPFRARARFRGFQLTATDTSWTAGDGQPIEGPIEAILLVLTGRLVALPGLSGTGAAPLTAQLTAALLSPRRPGPRGSLT